MNNYTCEICEKEVSKIVKIVQNGGHTKFVCFECYDKHYKIKKDK